MMKWIFSGMILLSVVFGIGQGRMDAVTHAAISDSGKAIQLAVALAGSMALWSGLMHVADKAGLTVKISRLFSPFMGLLFKGLDHRGAAAKAITLNISANLLGLGNAATPLGVTAMKELQKNNPDRRRATDNMAMLVIINTASLQLIPTTTALLRANAGAASPLDFMPAVWAASLASITAGVVMAKFLARCSP